jgi:membrane fusion protein, multidrug efflux system
MQQKEDARFKGKQNPSPGVRPDTEEEQPIDSVPLYRNFRLVIPLFAVVLVVAAVAWHYFLNRRDFVSTDDANIDGNRVSISTRILGRINQLSADEGDTVRRGQVLVRLDDGDLKAQQRQARASLSLARENVALAKVGLDRSQADFGRASTQFRDHVITGEQMDHARSELESAKARYGIALAQTQLAEAQLGIVETQLLNTAIESPMDGVVSKRWALAGDVVQPGQAVFSVTDLEHLWVTAYLEETHLKAIRIQDKVSIRVDAYPSLSFAGTVVQIGSNTAAQFSLIPPNNAAGNFTKITQRVPVKISIEASADSPAARAVRLIPGMSVEVKVRVH